MIKLSLLPIHIRHLCMRVRIDGKKAMSCGISGGKQVLKFASTSNRGKVCFFDQTEMMINSHAECTVQVSFVNLNAFLSLLWGY